MKKRPGTGFHSGPVTAGARRFAQERRTSARDHPASPVKPALYASARKGPEIERIMSTGLLTSSSAMDPRAGNLKEIIMLYTIAVVLVILWALGLVSSYTMGGFIHVLLVIAIIVILLNVIGGRRTG